MAEFISLENPDLTQVLSTLQQNENLYHLKLNSNQLSPVDLNKLINELKITAVRILELHNSKTVIDLTEWGETPLTEIKIYNSKINLTSILNWLKNNGTVIKFISDVLMAKSCPVQLVQEIITLTERNVHNKYCKNSSLQQLAAAVINKNNIVSTDGGVQFTLTVLNNNTQYQFETPVLEKIPGTLRSILYDNLLTYDFDNVPADENLNQLKNYLKSDGEALFCLKKIHVFS